MEESDDVEKILSEMEWKARQELESAEYNEVLLRTYYIYRVKPESASQKMCAFLSEVAYFTYECEREAKKRGISLHPLSISELRTLYPELG